MVDAVGGVAKIVGVALKINEAANTVHQNKKDCHHIKSRVDILNRTLSHHENNTELVEDSAVMAALEALAGILAEALEVITKCQEQRNILCVYYTAGNLSRRLNKVEQRISYVSSDVMLTIMSYQLLRKFQEGAPHPPPQTYTLGKHMPVQPPSPPQKMSKQNQDEAIKKDQSQRSEVPKFGSWDTAEQPSYTVYFEKVRECRKPNTAGEVTGEPRRNLVRGIAEVTRNIKEAVETVLQNRDECAEIAKLANKVSALVPRLEDTKILDDPAMRGSLEKLHLKFRRAHKLVIACQRKGRVPVWLSTQPARLSRQLHEVLDQIASIIADMTAIVFP